MIHPDAQLVDDVFDKEALEKIPTRNGFGEGLVDAGEGNEDVVALCADLTESTRTHFFKEKFPERFVELGVAEQNLATVASGMAAYGKIPFIASYAAFNPGRNNEQIRTTISLNHVPVKIAGAHAGVSVGPDGATHQALEDIALMRAQPHMTVIYPCDKEEARKATREAANYPGPVYLRFARAKTSVFTTPESPFEIGKAQMLFEARGDLPNAGGIIGCGPLIHNALLAAHKLEEEGLGISVMNLHTVKPMDEEAVLGFAKHAGRIVTVEEHQVHGGVGSAVAEFLAKKHPMPMEFIGVQDQFGQSGDPDELIEEYGMGVDAIVDAVKRLQER